MGPCVQVYTFVDNGGNKRVIYQNVTKVKTGDALETHNYCPWALFWAFSQI